MEDYIARVSHQYYISTQPSGKRRSDGHTTRDSLSGTTQSPLGRSQIIGIGLSERDWNESESFEKDDKHSRDAKMFSVGLSMDVFDQSMVEDLTSSENYEQFLGSYYTPRSCATWEWIRKVASSVCSCVEEATLIHPKLVAFREEVPELEVFTASFRGALLVPSPVHLTNLLDGREQHLITKSKYSKYANEIDKYLQTKILQVQSGKRREERLKSILLTPTSSTSSLMSSSSSQPGLHKSSDDQSPRRARANVISRNDPTEALLERQLAGIPKHYIHSPKRENAAGTNKKLEVEYQLQSYLQQSSNNLFLTMSNISLHCGSCSRRALREQQLAASIVSKETISQVLITT